PFWDLETTDGGLLLRAVEPVFPLVGRARPIGAVTIARPLDSDFAETMKRLANAEIRIFLGDGVVATTLFTERRTRKTEETLSSAVAARVRARARVHQVERAGPFAYQVVYMPLADARGRLVGTLAVGVSRYLVDRLQRITRITVIILTVIVLGLAALLGVLSADRITRPVRELIAGTRRVAAGEYDFTIRSYLEDEIGALAQSFNAMIFGLRERRLLRDAFGKYMSPRVAEAILTRPGGVRLAGERRDVSVFFTDVRGFTALSGSQPPEEIVRLLNVHFTLLVDIVFAHEGTVDKFTGDGLMAVFGAPLDQPDHAARALRCAVDIQRALQKERERGLYHGAAPLSVGIGVASGEAVVGDIGAEKRREYSVIGDCVNLAARLMGIAESDGILAAPETARRADGVVPLKRREAVQLKGMTRPLEVFEVVWQRTPA
ncbi:MAG: adenylate/guanylate cyclase domain-containing protein, partial [bacterium]